MTDSITRQIVWDSAFAILDGMLDDAHEFASRIADKFAEDRAINRSGRCISEEKRAAIKHDLTTGYWTYAQLRARHGVGTSTIQRLAQELRRQGITVHTVGSRNSGRDFRRCRHIRTHPEHE